MRLAAAPAALAAAASLIGCGGNTAGREQSTAPDVRECGADETGYGSGNLAVGNACEYEVAVGDEKIVGSCNEGQVKDQREASAGSGATLSLRAISDYRAMPYDHLDLMMGTDDDKTFWPDLEGFRWMQGADSAPVSYISFYLSRYPQRPTPQPTNDASPVPPPFSVSCGVGQGILGANAQSFDFEIRSVHEVCQLAGDGFFLVHGSLRATCEVNRNGAPTTQQASIRVDF